jgi:hypothetical protein
VKGALVHKQATFSEKGRASARRRSAAVWLFGLAALLLCGCGQPMARQQQSVDGLTIAIEYPQRLTLMKEVELLISLSDAAGRPVDGAVVTLDMVMPEMPMGQNRPLADPLGGGRYRIRTAYTMLGSWQTTVLVSVGGKDYRATFVQEVAA